MYKHTPVIKRTHQMRMCNQHTDTQHTRTSPGTLTRQATTHAPFMRYTSARIPAVPADVCRPSPPSCARPFSSSALCPCRLSEPIHVYRVCVWGGESVCVLLPVCLNLVLCCACMHACVCCVCACVRMCMRMRGCSWVCACVRCPYLPIRPAHNSDSTEPGPARPIVFCL